MNTDNHIEEYGILLEDVLLSREKALKNNKVEFVDSITCPRCGNTHLEKFYATNSEECWEDLCGIEGDCIFCSKCMDIVEFRVTCMS
jgi:late competence protein required for DNA uptake (superfamily II DNA/RNA helicase)